MKHSLFAACFVAALSCCCARLYAGEITEETPKPAPLSPVKGGASGANSKDPTQLSPRMREMLAPKVEPRAQEVAKAPPPKLPEILLRGLVVGKESQGSAALEVKGGSTVLVRAGSSFTAVSAGQSLMVRVRNISADSIELEIPELQQTLTIR